MPAGSWVFFKLRASFTGIRQPELEAIRQAMDVEHRARDVQSNDRGVRQVLIFFSFWFGIRMAAINRSS